MMFLQQTWIEQQWQNARLKLKTENAATVVLIIDEIQKINQWEEAVKLQWDKDSFEDIGCKSNIIGFSKTYYSERFNRILSRQIRNYCHDTGVIMK